MHKWKMENLVSCIRLLRALILPSAPAACSCFHALTARG